MGEGIGGGAVVFLLGLVLVAALVGGGLVLDNIVIHRTNAAAERAQAEALAYQVRTQAETQAMSERANVRQMERDAAHQRMIDTLPYMVLALGGAAVALVLVIMAWDLLRHRQPTPTGDPGLVFYLQRRDAELWRAIARLERQAPGDSRDVVIYSERERG